MNVLLLNASYQTHQVVSLRHAVKMLARKVAVVEESHEGETFGPYPKPKIVRLIKFVYAKWKDDTRPRCYSKKGVHDRDGFKCGYCGGYGDTIDHILPKCQGGKTTWLNTITACGGCNSDKEGLTPSQAGMPLLFEPWDPTPYGRARL